MFLTFRGIFEPLKKVSLFINNFTFLLKLLLKFNPYLLYLVIVN